VFYLLTVRLSLMLHYTAINERMRRETEIRKKWRQVVGAQFYTFFFRKTE
jgi:hypothetical protein